MALADRKIPDVFNKKTGGSKDTRSITNEKELEIKAEYEAGVHIADEGMFNTISPALYAIQKLSEDIDELRRFVGNEITSISTSQASAITANTAKRDATNIYVPLVCNMLNANCTTAQFVPFSDGITEGTSSTNPRNVFIAPANGTIKSIHIVSQNTLLEKGKGVALVATFSKRTNGSSSLTPCAAATMTTVAANTVMNADFAAAGKAGTLAFSKGEQILVSLQLTSGAPTGNKNYYVTVVFQLNQPNLD
jgi:hypothetical protein